MTASLTTAPAQGFTANLWDAASPIFAAILEHPFLRGLTDGSLPEEKFQFYVQQDSLYHALKSMAPRWDSREGTNQWC